MDKYIDYVFKNPEIEFIDKFYGGHCNGTCIKSEQFFQYGPDFVKKCLTKCMKTQEEFTAYLDKTRFDLEFQLNKCQDKTEGDQVKECMIHFQEQAYSNIKDYSEKLNQSLY